MAATADSIPRAPAAIRSDRWVDQRHPSASFEDGWSRPQAEPGESPIAWASPSIGRVRACLLPLDMHAGTRSGVRAARDTDRLGYVVEPGGGRRRMSHGAYTSGQVQHMATQDCSIENMLRVRKTLRAMTEGGRRSSGALHAATSEWHRSPQNHQVQIDVARSPR